MKNLDFALRVLQNVPSPVEFSIYGPQEDLEYWRDCEALMRTLPAHVSVMYHGPVATDEVHETLARHDLLFLPSRGENFGHVFLEAWAVGITVLVSDRTPWRGLKDAGVGWDLSLNHPGAFVAAIEEMSKWDVGARARARQRCLAWAREKSEDPEVLEDNRRLFRQVLRKDA